MGRSKSSRRGGSKTLRKRKGTWWYFITRATEFREGRVKASSRAEAEMLAAKADSRLLSVQDFVVDTVQPEE
jgi:hypothetical protein